MTVTKLKDRMITIVMHERDWDMLEEQLSDHINWMLDEHPRWKEEVKQLSRLEARIRKAVKYAAYPARKQILHVNRQIMAKNAKDNGSRPVFSIKTGRTTVYGRSVKINGPSQMVYSQEPLSCGAKAWIETDAPLDIEDEMTFKEARAAV